MILTTSLNALSSCAERARGNSKEGTIASLSSPTLLLSLPEGDELTDKIVAKSRDSTVVELVLYLREGNSDAVEEMMTECGHAADKARDVDGPAGIDSDVEEDAQAAACDANAPDADDCRGLKRQLVVGEWGC